MSIDSKERCAERQLRVLLGWGLEQRHIEYLIAGSVWFQDIGGIRREDYWRQSQDFSLRDEFLVVANSVFSLAGVLRKVGPVHDWCLSFHVAFLYQLKAHAQSVVAIDHLVRRRCYADAFAATRSMHSRINLLILCSLAPGLFQKWLEDPKNPLFFDGNIRNELDAHGIDVMDHIYESSSEVIHGQHMASTEVGYFEQGIFPQIRPIEGKLYTIGKILLAIAGFGTIHLCRLDREPGEPADAVGDMESLYGTLLAQSLHQRRLEHIDTMIAQERHWKKLRKNGLDIGGLFDFPLYRDQLGKFHRASGQHKSLSKKYRVLLKANQS